MSTSGRPMLPPRFSRVPIIGEGDSYMTLTTNGLILLVAMQLSLFFMRAMTSTAVAGSTVTGIKDRLAANAGVTTGRVVIWDGDGNSYGSVSAYLAVVDQITTIVGSTNYVFLRPCTRGPSDGTVSVLTLDMEAIGAGIASRGIITLDPVPLINTLNDGSPQDLLDIQARVICTSCLQVDATHLTTPVKQFMGAQMAALMQGANL